MTGEPPDTPIAALILAAGSATRMGRLKQLLPFRGKTLLQHAIDQATHAGFDPVVVVVGAQADTVAAAIGSAPVKIVRNDAWETGMGSSVAAGTRPLQQCDVAGVAILLADQPLVTARHLREMVSLLDGSNIVAAEYGGTLGVPAFFPRQMFTALASLAPEAGARHILRTASASVSAYPLPEAAIDIDTPDDLAALALTPN